MLKRFLPDDTRTNTLEYAVIAVGVIVAVVSAPLLRHYGW